MTPAIWTGIYATDTLPAALERLVGLGWGCFELSTEHLEAIDGDGDPPARIAEAKAALERLGVSMPQAHGYLGANVAHPDQARREGDRATLGRHLAHCAALGVRTVVMHPGVTPWTTRAQLAGILKLNREAFTRLGELAGELGLTIGIENTMDPTRSGGRVLGALPQELLELVAGVGSPALGITFDTSHAHCQRLDLPAAIREFGRLLCATHISDNDGSGDQHRMPGVGTIDWPAVVGALREIGYEGPFNLEIPGERHPVPEILARKLRHAREVAGWLVGEG